MAIGTAARLLTAAGTTGRKARMAGNVWNTVKDAAGLQGPASALLRFGPDVFFGTLAGVNTPGDLTDKIIAGTASTAGQLIGGIGLSSLGIGSRKIRAGGGAHSVLDMIGSVGGDFGGMAVGDQLMKGKDLIGGGSGQTPYERLGEEQRRDIERNILAQYGLGGYNLNNINPGLVMSNGMV